MNLVEMRFSYSGSELPILLRSDTFDDGSVLGYSVLHRQDMTLILQIDRRIWAEVINTVPIYFGAYGLTADLSKMPEDERYQIVWALLRAAAADLALDTTLSFSGDEWRVMSDNLPKTNVTAPQVCLSQLLASYPNLAYKDAPTGDIRALHEFMAKHNGEDGCDAFLGLVVACCDYMYGIYNQRHIPADDGAYASQGSGSRDRMNH